MQGFNTDAEAKRHMDLGLPSESTSLATLISFSVKLGQTSPPSGLASVMEITSELSPGCNLWPSCLQLDWFILRSLQVPALTSLSPLLLGPAQDKCQELMCKCDQAVAYCLAQTEYTIKYLFYPRFLCEKDSPKCDWLAWLEMSFLHKEIKLLFAYQESYSVLCRRELRPSVQAAALMFAFSAVLELGAGASLVSTLINVKSLMPVL